jgi:phenylacetate-CoA ligase
MRFAGRMLLGLHHRLKGCNSLAMLREMESRSRLSREEILAYQFSQLSALLAEAEAHVPYYREMFQKLGIRSQDIRSAEDFSSLPILTKDIIRERAQDLVREDVAKDKLRVSHSGGSTGVPLSFYHDGSYDDASEAGTFRNLTECGWKPGDVIAYIWGGNNRLYAMPRWKVEFHQYLLGKYTFDPFYSGPEEMDAWLEKWKRIKPSVIYGYASTIARFGEHIQARGRKLPPLRGVFSTAERLYQPQREVISDVFGCRVYDCYGSSEVRNIAAECSNGRMHVNADYVVLEVDRTGVGSGEPTPFIVTSLLNRVMPFIRYRSEDCGQLVEGACDCGSQFPLMDLKIARTSDSFVLPGGRVVHGEFFTHLMYGSQGISSFQFHQTDLNSVVLWIVPGPGEAGARERSIQDAVEKVRQLDPASRIEVEVRTTEAIPLSRAGKHRFIRSDVRSETPTLAGVSR